MIKVFEGFCGYGGASFGLKEANIEHKTVGFSEIDKNAIKCYINNHGNIKNFGDITQINPYDIEDFDLFTGGFPCVAFSNAGKRLGELDPRGRLFHEIIRICEVKKPRYMLLENVKGLTHKKFKDTFNTILSELNRIGYNVKWKVLNSRNFGTPQNRERVWFACFRNIEDFNKFDFPKETGQTKILKDILEPNADSKYYWSERRVKGVIKSFYQDRKPQDINKICATLKIGGDNKGIYDYITNRKEPVIIDVYHLLFAEARPITTYIPEDNKVHRCLQAGIPKEVLLYKGNFRSLTPRECFRLMGFFRDQINLEGLSDSAKYKLAGNGWCINVASRILKEMLK